ncbi:MAG: sirohydrochlorin cobaltochelatase [Lachnospiraceae bacterium]|nr:sirohydrochlorin cobaltochelatase [Lachnospiraceae bacterium]
MKKLLAALMIGALAVGGLTACGQEAQKVSGKEQPENPGADEEDEENYETGDASLDNPRNQDDIGEKELLVVSFGTSFNDSRRLTIGAIESAIDDAVSDDYSVRRAFTSQIIIDHVAKRDGEQIDNLKDALDRAVKNGVKTLVVQPTHLMDGYEYNDIIDELADYSDAFEKIVIGKNLLSTDDDFEAVIKAVTDETKKYDDGQTAICFMGHGTEADSNGIYAKLQEMITADGYANYYIGTVEAEPSIDDLIKAVKAGGYKKVVLEPLMVVAGDHANNDMAGDDEDSWKNRFEAEGFEVECILKGLGEIPAVRDIYVAHAKETLAEVK